MTKHGDDGVTWDESFGRKVTVIGETLRIHGECVGADPQGSLQIFAPQWGHAAGEWMQQKGGRVTVTIWRMRRFT